MKKILIVLLILASGTIVLAKGKPTDREIIESAESVDFIVSFGEVTVKIGLDVSSICPAITETADLSLKYLSNVGDIVNSLNKGFETDKIKKIDADASIIDWKTYEGKTFIIYKVLGFYATGKDIASQIFTTANKFYVNGYMQLCTVENGEIKHLNGPLGQLISYATTPDKKIAGKCATFPFFEENFPSNMLEEKFTASTDEKLQKYIDKENKRYEKAMKKKK